MKYLQIFHTCLLPEPAKVPPMVLRVDEKGWRVNSNKGPARQQTGPKQEEIEKQVSGMLKNNVLRISQAEYYSQAHLTPKPEGKWRFCLDYRKFNMVCEGMGWPLPNIQHMIQRLGKKKPKYFAKIDLTSGYHQAPLHENSRVYTAFITFMGIFEWLRVPMGLKEAPAYFQSILATIVLA